MQYALLIYAEPGTVEALSPAEREELSRDYWALRDEPEIIGGAGLQPVTTATTVRLDGRDVRTRAEAATSLMPAGLLDALTDGEVADLYAYLRSR